MHALHLSSTLARCIEILDDNFFCDRVHLQVINLDQQMFCVFLSSMKASCHDSAFLSLRRFARDRECVCITNWLWLPGVQEFGYSLLEWMFLCFDFVRRFIDLMHKLHLHGILRNLHLWRDSSSECMFLLPVSFCGKIIVRNDAMSCEKFTTTSPPTLVISQLFEFSRSCGFFLFWRRWGETNRWNKQPFARLEAHFAGQIKRVWCKLVSCPKSKKQ